MFDEESREVMREISERASKERARVNERSRKTSTKWREKHPERQRASVDKWQKENPAKVANMYLKYTYGITVEERNNIFASQGEVCAVCKVSTPGWKHGWHTDHDHSTGKVRGVLCHGCNTGIGKFKDSLELLQAAAAYLGKRN